MGIANQIAFAAREQEAEAGEVALGQRAAATQNRNSMAIDGDVKGIFKSSAPDDSVNLGRQRQIAAVLDDSAQYIGVRPLALRRRTVSLP